MSVELRPLGVTCNIACHYCYQNPQREAGNFRQRYDLVQMKDALERIGQPFVLFGGEPLLMPLDDLEDIWRWGFERFGRNTIQTNGVLISDQHMELFQKYNVFVGISIDGPGDLNDTRWNHTLAKTRAATASVEANIERLVAAGRPPALITTLHTGNARAEHLPRMGDWFRRLDQLGIRSVRLHLLEVEKAVLRRHALSERENVEAILFFARLQDELSHMRFDVVEELKRLLLGKDARVSCVWRACDPYTTPAVQGVEGNGQSSNCGRTNKDGVDFLKAESGGFERYLMLYQLPQEHGGCAGCRFFMMCKGQCPGTALDGDWRNRTEHCEIWKSLFEHAEQQLITTGQVPISQSAERTHLEARLLKLWAQGINPSIQQLRQRRRSTPVRQEAGANA